MRRFLFTIPAGLSLLLLAAVLVAWAFSHYRRVKLNHWGTEADRSWSIDGYLSRGAVMVRYNRGVCNVSGGRYRFTEWNVGPPIRLGKSFDLVEQSSFPKGSLISHRWQRSYFAVHLKGYREEFGDWNVVNRDRICTALVLLWAIAVPFAILPAAWLARARPALRRRRLRAGLCTRCGYDLRATPGRCPECGESPPRLTAMPSLRDLAMKP